MQGKNMKQKWENHEKCTQVCIDSVCFSYSYQKVCGGSKLNIKTIVALPLPASARHK